jgi:phage terminase large subunit-like protein
MIIPNHIQDSIPFKYAQDVRSGKIVTGRKIKLAVERFYKMIDTAKEKGYWLNFKKGFAPIIFFETFLRHTKGAKSGQPVILSPHQQFAFFNVYGWQRFNENGEKVRLIRNVYTKVAKKNGKTLEEAGDGLFAMSFDFERGAEVYVGATKEDQAKICFNQAVGFINTNSALHKIGFRVYQKQIKFLPTNSFMKPLGGDSKTQDGINSHRSILDEYHAHRDNTVKENLESSSAARKQPITKTITTAGFNIHGVCKKFEESCERILEGIDQDDSFFIMMHDLDAKDDWEDPKNWIKANPNLGSAVSMEFLMGEYKKAKNQPSKIPNFKTKHLNMWVDAPEVWIEAEYWDQCQKPIKEENFRKYGNCGGLDLSSTTDITAYAMMSYPDEDGVRDLKVWCFCPKDTIDKRSKEDGVPYRKWASMKREGAISDDDTYLIATDGNMVDYNVVAKVTSTSVIEHATDWVEYDRKFSAGLVMIFQEKDIEMSPFSQTIMNFSSPTKEFERLVRSGKLRVGKNPVLKWMLSGCVPKYDENENVRLTKAMATKRIDGIVGGIMALAGTLSVKEEEDQSKYNDPNAEMSFG